MTQIVYYETGVGTGNRLDRIAGGTLSVGLSRNVREAYAFIVNNCGAGDKIFLFGFSRGANTPRCAAGLVGRVGILRKRQMGDFTEAWDWNRRTSAEREATRAAFEARSRERDTTATIRSAGVLDTMGALGIPTNRFNGMWRPCMQAYRFLDAQLG